MEQELEKTFEGGNEVKGFTFTQIENSKYGYIYEVEISDHKYYEIFERRLVKICIDFENRIYSETDFKVAYPRAKAFGDWAWTCKDLDRAYIILNKIKGIILDRERRKNEIILDVNK